MVSIVGLNPFSQQSQPNGGAAPEPQPTENNSNQAVKPAEDTKTGNDTGAANAGSGNGNGAANGTQNPRQPEPNAKPVSGQIPSPDRAEPASVVAAQVTEQFALETGATTEDAARQNAIDQMAKQRTANLIESIGAPVEAKIAELPDKPTGLPDPLPTSPFLKGADEAS